ncbi:MAG: hypothetical protein WCG34_08180, partial [Leptolinea sp.]
MTCGTGIGVGEGSTGETTSAGVLVSATSGVAASGVELGAAVSVGSATVVVGGARVTVGVDFPRSIENPQLSEL